MLTRSLLVFFAFLLCGAFAAVLPFFLLLPRRQPRSTLFPYTTLFRSEQLGLKRVKVAITGGSASAPDVVRGRGAPRLEEHTSELQSPYDLVCRLLLEKKKNSNQPMRILVMISHFRVEGYFGYVLAATF